MSTTHFELRIKLGDDVDNRPWDVARALRDAADRITGHGELPPHPGAKIRDVFGNTVGWYGTAGTGCAR